MEPQARGVYCAAAGVVLPGGAARFNVPIRTVTVRRGRAISGVGSGITAGATGDGEWAEWEARTQFLEPAVRVGLASRPITPADPLPAVLAAHAINAPAAFLRHKTTRQDHYGQFAADTPGIFDTLLWNERG